MPNQNSTLNQTAWQQNGHTDYVPFNEDDDEELFTVDDTDCFPNNQNNQRPDPMNAGLGHTQAAKQQPPVQHGQLPKLSPSSPSVLPQPKLQNNTAGAQAMVTKTPIVNDSAARAAELRAKLLAKKSSNTASTQASPAVRNAELADKKQNNVQESFTKKTDSLAAGSRPENTFRNSILQAAPEQMTNEASITKAPDRSPGKTINDDIDHLLAEGRNAADAPKPGPELTNGQHIAGINGGKPAVVPADNVQQIGPSSQEPRPILKKALSSSDLSEPGEIHSGPSSPVVAGPHLKSTQTTNNNASIPQSTESKHATQDKNEKLMRQNEVKKAYQPLKSSKAPTSEPSIASGGTLPSSEAHIVSKSAVRPDEKMSDGSKANDMSSPKLSNKQIKQNKWREKIAHLGKDHERSSRPQDPRREQDWDRGRDAPARRDDGRQLRRSSISQAYADPSDLKRDVETRRRRMSEDQAKRVENERRAAEYKKTLENQRPRAPQPVQSSPKTAKDDRKQEREILAPQASGRSSYRAEPATIEPGKNPRASQVETGNGELGDDAVMLSPAEQNIEDEDLNDWLELTDYHDLAHRERRLTLFRKRRALDIQRAELEREEQLELHERSLLKRAQSTLPTSTPPKVTRRASVLNVRMPPPPLPLKQSNHDSGIKIKDSAVATGLATPVSSRSNLKRQHGEDDLESRRMQPAEKIARTDLNGNLANEKSLTSPASAKEVSSIKGEAVPLESRISRDEDRFRPRFRARSRSPEYRRRSMSPRRQRYPRSPSPQGNRTISGENRDYRTCYNCSKPGHFVNECPEQRRDGKEWSGKEWTTPSGYQQWISPNYRGRNPVARGGGNHSPHPYSRGGGNNRSRYSSVGKNEESEIGNGIGRENIGSVSLNLGAGGQSRRGNYSPHPYSRGGGNNRSRYSSVGKNEESEIGNGIGRENIGSVSLNLGAGGQSRR